MVILEVKPIVAGDEKEDFDIEEHVQMLYGHGHDHDHDEEAEEKVEMPVAEPDEQEGFDIEEGEEQVQVQVQRIQRMVQSVGALDCLESVGHVPSVERPPEPHVMQRYLEGSGP